MEIECLKEFQNKMYLFLENLNCDLFPINFEIVPKDNLADWIVRLTNEINQDLDFYHKLTEYKEKIELKPILIFMQIILARMTRLLVFEQRHLTRHNQILMDLSRYLTDFKQLIKNECLEQAERELSLMNDQKFRKMLSNCLESMRFFRF
ncbi:MAG: hypothetical protein ACTSRZ_07540 [Promethearchaeota archaeon]